MSRPGTTARTTSTTAGTSTAARTSTTASTSAQPSAAADPDLVRRAADLCRRRPAVFAAVVRHADALERAGTDRRVALDRALTDVGW